jgi:hypothetical protein
LVMMLRRAQIALSPQLVHKLVLVGEGSRNVFPVVKISKRFGSLTLSLTA